MTAVKTTNEINYIMFSATGELAASEHQPAAFKGEVKTNEKGEPLFRCNALALLILDENGKIRGQRRVSPSVTIAKPIDLEYGKLYVPVGVYTWNDWSMDGKSGTSIVVETLKEVKQ